MKKRLVFLLSAIMAVCMCGFAVTYAEGNPVTLELPAALGAGDNCFTAEVSPSLYTAESVFRERSSSSVNSAFSAMANTRLPVSRTRSSDKNSIPETVFSKSKEAIGSR